MMQQEYNARSVRALLSRQVKNRQYSELPQVVGSGSEAGYIVGYEDGAEVAETGFRRGQVQRCEGRNNCILEDIDIWAKLGSSPRRVVMKIPEEKKISRNRLFHANWIWCVHNGSVIL
jgi:hypothetical protein